MVHVSCVQIHPQLADFRKNVDKILGYIDTIMVARPETNLIVFPELATTGYECTKEEFQALAETVPEGESIQAVAAKCKRYNVNIVYGFAERDPLMRDILYNSAVFINNHGMVLGQYRKVHPFDTERQWCRPGCEYPVFETDFGKVGVMICWDAGFPEVARTYALKGVDLLVVCTNWEKPYSADWDLLTKARAFDNTLHLVSANRIGDDKVLGFFGHSNIIDPLGRVIQSLDDEVEGVIHATLDLSLTPKYRYEYYTFLKDRRPDTYGDLTAKY